MADASGPKVLFFGMPGAFSLSPLEGLLQADIEVRAVVLPASPAVPGIGRPLPPAGEGTDGLRILTPYLQRNIVHVAWEHGIPVYEVADLNSSETVDLLAGLAADVLAVACFDRLIPGEVRRLVQLAVNVHPSLLPDNRGPSPLFWTFRLGQAITGVTVHLLEERADAGAILAQREVPVPDGIDGAELELRLAGIGAELLVQAIREFAAGQLRPRLQDEERATQHHWPVAEDWIVPGDWPERRAANFLKGVAHLAGPQQSRAQQRPS